MRYSMRIVRVEPHPKAGQSNYNGGFNSQYPNNIEVEVMTVDLTEGEYRAVKRAILSVTEPKEEQ